MHVSEKPDAAVFAVAQSGSVAGDIETNIQRHLRFMELASSKGADLLMFPELSLTGYEPALARELALRTDDPRLQPMRDLARELKLVTLVGAPVRSAIAGEVLIASLVFQAGGELALYYKQHLHSGETQCLARETGARRSISRANA